MTSRLTLTARDALARALRVEYNQQKQHSGEAVWSTPAIHSLRQWVKTQWLKSWPQTQLLHPTQTLAVWESIVRDGQLALIAPRAAAREAQSADQVARLHDIDCASTCLTEEQEIFARWRSQFNQRLTQNRWITAADLHTDVLQLIQAGAIEIPDEITLVGFSFPLPPTQQAILNALSARGSIISTEKKPPNQPKRWVVDDAQAQFTAVAWQIRERLTAAARNPASDPPRILVILPDVAARRAQLDSAFRPILAPWLFFPEEITRPVPWRYECGQPLAEHPLIHAAITALHWTELGIPNEKVSQLLLNSALWSPDERLALARMDRQLRERRLPQLSLWHITQQLKQLPESLTQRFARFIEQLRSLPRRTLPSDFAERWQTMLSSLGWPGAATDSESFQAQRAFDDGLSVLAALDLQLGEIPPSTALHWLGEILRSQPFSPRTEVVQPITILSIEEAPGTPCDTVFVLDLTDENYPPRSTATAFISLPAQRAAQVVSAANDLQLATAEAQVQSILSLCPDVTLLAPKMNERGAETAPSSLWGSATTWTPFVEVPRNSLLKVDLALITPKTDPVPPVINPVTEDIRGGTGIFKSFVEAPFYAFVRHRLGVDELTQPPHGLDALRQGNLMHDALREFWGNCTDQGALLQLQGDALTAAILTALDAVFDAHLHPKEFSRAQRMLEHTRVLDILTQWLKHEQRRVDPFRVVHREVKTQTTVAGIPLKFTIDRVDEVKQPDGQRAWLMMDYKTGKEATPSGWKTDKLKEPQLPLYASCTTLKSLDLPQVDGIAFGHLRDGHPTLSALTRWRQKLIDPKPDKAPSDWDTQLLEWQQRLTDIAQAFCAGEANLPAKAKNKSLNLLARRAALAEDGNDDEGEAE